MDLHFGVATDRWSPILELNWNPRIPIPAAKDLPVTCPESRYVRTPAMCFDGIIVTVSVAQAPWNDWVCGSCRTPLISGIRNWPWNVWLNDQFSCNDCKSSNWNNHLSTFVDVSWCFWLPRHHRSLTHFWSTFYEECVFHINRSSHCTSEFRWHSVASVASGSVGILSSNRFPVNHKQSPNHFFHL